MRRAVPIVAVSAMLLASIAVVPAGAFGGGQGFNPNGGFRGFNPNGGFTGFNPNGGFTGFNPSQTLKNARFSKDGRFFPHHKPNWGFAGSYLPGVYGGAVYYNDPPVVEDAPMYAPAPVYTPPPVYVQVVVPIASAAEPPAPARPSVVEYPGGRYELRGDGVGAPYNWVWIPNPPVVPPAPTAPPAGLAPSSSDRPAVRRSELYRWDDEQGVVHLTDNAAAVPERFRQNAPRTDAR
jgi:hypothetical protein